MSEQQAELLPADAGEGLAPVPAEPIVIDRPGIYDLPEDVYHSDPVPGGSASSSTLRDLLKRSPAEVHHDRVHGMAPKKAWDLGTGMHKKVLGKGAELVLVERADGKTEWNTDAVKAEVAAVRAAGKVPLKRAELAAIDRMATAVLEHPTAGALFAEGMGVAEQSIFWTDERTGAPCRAMLDWLSLLPGYPPTIVDLKSMEKSPSLPAVLKTVAEHRYYQQDPWYRSAVESLGFDYADIDFIFVFVGTRPPHLITLFRLADIDLLQGERRNAEALDLWIKCTETGVWPGYSEEIQTDALPRWAHN